MLWSIITIHQPNNVIVDEWCFTMAHQSRLGTSHQIVPTGTEHRRNGWSEAQLLQPLLDLVGAFNPYKKYESTDQSFENTWEQEEKSKMFETTNKIRRTNIY